MLLRKNLIWIVGDGGEPQSALLKQLRDLGTYDVKTCPISDIPHLNSDKLPDILLIVLSAEGAARELEVLDQLPSSNTVPILVIGPGDNTQLMRKAMHLGVKDYLVTPPDFNECLSAIKGLILQKQAGDVAARRSELVAFIDAKAGSGSSFLAANVAHLMVATLDLSTCLVELDLQFGSLAAQLDLKPERYLLEVINIIDELDSLALRSHLTKGRDGLEVLLARADDVVLPGDVAPQKLARMLKLLRTAYPFVVVHLPHLVDPLMALVMSEATRVVLVMQQRLLHVRDAKRLHRLMTMDLGVMPQQIILVVNRYDEAIPVTLDDIARILPNTVITTVCNDYGLVSQAQDLGKPLAEYAPSSQVSSDLLHLAERVTGRPVPAPARGFWARMFGEAR